MFCHLIYSRFLFYFSALCFFPGLPWCWQSSLLSVFLLSYSSLPHLPRRESGVSLMYLTQMLTLWVFSVCLSTDVCLSVAVFASVSLSCLSVLVKRYTCTLTQACERCTPKDSPYIVSRPASTVWWACTVRRGTMAMCGFPGRSCSTSLTAIKQGHSTCSSASAAA